jgi:hypothetical protein
MSEAIGTAALHSCPYCAPVLVELETMRRDYDVLERLMRVDSALARQLSRSISENARLRAEISELQAKATSPNTRDRDLLVGGEEIEAAATRPTGDEP